MKYMFLIYVDSHRGEPDPDGGDAGEIAEHVTFTRDAIARGAYVSCDALASEQSAKTVRVRDGQVVTTDGPFAETKEALGGFYILDCKDMDEALGYASRIPPAKHGSIEVRPIFDIPGWDEAVGLKPASVASR